MGSIYLPASAFHLVAPHIQPERVEECVRRYPGYLEKQLELVAAQIEERLRHKYQVPFPENHLTIQGWIAGIVQLRVQLRVGIDPNDALLIEMKALADLIETQLVDAGDPQSSRWNLPLASAGDKSAVTKGAPFGYSESNPYAWTDTQWEGQ